MFKCIFQQNQSECGVACLSMVLSEHKIENCFSEIKTVTDTNDKGTSFIGLINAAEHFGLKAEALEGSLKDFEHERKTNPSTLPCIAHVKTDNGNNHFVVIYRIIGSLFLVADPEKGKKLYTRSEIKKIWLGHILCFEKSEKSRKKPNKNFKYYVILNKNKLVLLCFLCVFVSLLEVIGTFGVSMLIERNNTTHVHEELNEADVEIDSNSYIYKFKLQEFAEFISENEEDIFNVDKLFIILLFLFIGVFIFELFRGLILSLINRKIDKSIIEQFFSDLLDNKQEFYTSMDSGSIIGRFGDIDRIKNALANSLVIIFLDSMTMIFSAVVLIVISPKMFFLSLPIVIVYGVVIYVFSSRIKRRNNESMEQNSKILTYINEYISGAESIRNTSFENYIVNRTRDYIDAYVQSKFRLDVISFLQISLTGLTSVIGTLIILRIGIAEVQSGALLNENLLAFYMLISYFISPIRHLVELQAIIQSANTAWQRLKDIFSFTKESDNSELLLKTVEFDELKVEKLSVGYKKSCCIVQNINLCIHPGDRFLVSGQNGAGKTTLAKAISGMLDIENNTIFLNGRDINHISKKHYRTLVRYLPSNPFFFNDTVLNNLVTDNKNISKEAIVKTCYDLGISSLISDLSDGLETILYNNASNLSEGQRQLLAIVRCLLQKPNVLIFDEATCSIDSNLECELYRRIGKIYPSMALLVITHRYIDHNYFNHFIMMQPSK